MELTHSGPIFQLSSIPTFQSANPLWPESVREILRGRPDVGGEITAAQDAQLAHDADVIGGINEIAPGIQGLEVDRDGYLGCHFERIAVIANLDYPAVGERCRKPVVFCLIGVNRQI